MAESETDVLYDALAAKGRWATQGILFATGKAELQPESRPVLKEIAATLKQHADLKILIEGHTDNVGARGAQPHAERCARGRGEGGAGRRLRRRRRAASRPKGSATPSPRCLTPPPTGGRRTGAWRS